MSNKNTKTGDLRVKFTTKTASGRQVPAGKPVIIENVTWEREQDRKAN